MFLLWIGLLPSASATCGLFKACEGDPSDFGYLSLENQDTCNSTFNEATELCTADCSWRRPGTQAIYADTSDGSDDYYTFTVRDAVEVVFSFQATGLDLALLQSKPSLEPMAAERSPEVLQTTALDSGGDSHWNVGTLVPGDYVIRVGPQALVDTEYELEVEFLQPELEFVLLGDHVLPVWTNRAALNEERISRLVVTVHGAGGPSRAGFDSAVAVAAEEGVGDNTLVVTPAWQEIHQRCDEDGEFVWKKGDRGTWIYGNMDQGDETSSFEVMDALVEWANRFGAMDKTVVAGHSAGGQFVHRYAAFTPLPEQYAMGFVAANPATWMYLDTLRPLQGNAVDPQSIPDIEVFYERLVDGEIRITNSDCDGSGPNELHDHLPGCLPGEEGPYDFDGDGLVHTISGADADEERQDENAKADCAAGAGAYPYGPIATPEHLQAYYCRTEESELLEVCEQYRTQECERPEGCQPEAVYQSDWLISPLTWNRWTWRYLQREILLMVGSRDTETYVKVDGRRVESKQKCPARLQGADRRIRGLHYFNHLGGFYSGGQVDSVMVVGAGHDAAETLMSSFGRAAIYH